MITLKELIKNNDYNSLPQDTKNNLDKLLLALNKIRVEYNKPMIITSGLRSPADQQRINPAAPKSKHLIGAAADVLDTDGELWKWCMINIQLIIEAGLYLEDKLSTPQWVHFQCIAPKSGNRIFKP